MESTILLTDLLRRAMKFNQHTIVSVFWHECVMHFDQCKGRKHIKWLHCWLYLIITNKENKEVKNIYQPVSKLKLFVIRCQILSYECN